MQNITLRDRALLLITDAIKLNNDIYNASSIFPLIDYRVKRAYGLTTITWHAQARYAIYQSQKRGGSAGLAPSGGLAQSGGCALTASASGWARR